jgi:hypothetical protein
MPLFSLDRDSAELLNQNYRLPDVAPGGVPPGRGAAAASQHPDIYVNDEAIHALPFRNIGESLLEPERVYSVRVAGDLIEPDFTYRGGADTWKAGAAAPAGQRLMMRGARLKKISQVVRVDRRMTDKVMDVMFRLAQTAIVRALSEAIWSSAPPSDDGETFSGLPTFLTPSQDLAFDSTQSYSANFDRLLARCHPSGNGEGTDADVIVCSESALINYTADRENRGLSVECYYSPLTGRIQRHHRGKPLLVGRVPEPAGSGVTWAYTVKLLGPSGITVAHRGGDPEALGAEIGPVTTMIGLDATGEAASSTVGAEVWGEYALLVPEAQSVARMTGVPNV